MVVILNFFHCCASVLVLASFEGRSVPRRYWMDTLNDKYEVVEGSSLLAEIQNPISMGLWDSQFLRVLRRIHIKNDNGGRDW
jgi:hypothetical protein